MRVMGCYSRDSEVPSPTPAPPHVAADHATTQVRL